MSAKLLHPLTDESMDLQKQVGCMNGIFHLFDRHRLVTNRRINSHSHKRLPSANRENHSIKHVDSPRPQAFLPKDAPRHSYDEREARDTWKSSMKLKEFPRLSLDSREGTIRSASESRSNYLLDDLPGSNKRPSSIVAKLMGLEALPDTESGKDQIRNIKCCPDEGLDQMSPSRKINETKHNQASRSPRTAQKELASPQLRNFSSSMRLSTRFPLEPAPWRQTEANQSSQTKAQNACPSVYGEFEKRIAKLEFKRSGKDLRALKQILEAMQNTRKRLDTEKEDLDSVLDSQRSNNSPKNHNFSPKPTSAKQSSQITPKKVEASIVINKPAKVVQKPRNAGSFTIPIEGISSSLPKLRTTRNAESRKDWVNRQTIKDLIPRNNHLREPSCQPRMLRSTQTPKESQQMTGGNTISSRTSSTTTSPRLQRKQELEKYSRPTTHTTDSSRVRRHLGKHQAESRSPRRKLRPTSPSLQGDAISEQSESSISLISHNDTKVTSTDHPKEISGTYQYEDQKAEVCAAAKLGKDSSKVEAAATIFEQPSPISVLDATFYGEETPSPVKKISSAFEDDETLDSNQAEWDVMDLDHLPNGTRPNLSPAFGREKLENIKQLICKLRQVNVYSETATGYSASLHENTDQDHSYVTKILLASGLLKDLGSSSPIIQLHSSGHLINPDLFLVLEQTIDSVGWPENDHSTRKICQSNSLGKIHRKLIFDTVNEILVHKLTSVTFCDPWISPNSVGAKSFGGQKLLKEVCLEINHLQAQPHWGVGYEDDDLINILTKDMMHEKQNWESYYTEFPELILDIERLIFKDLIDEILAGEIAAFQGRQTKHCRQLFSK
ncbi:hypothetical protein NMG60_11028501 [Bertholletia excelsa]